jgi:hypothetical protein
VDAAGNAYAMTGMAFHPTSGVLYGSTSNQSPTSSGYLVTIDPLTGLVTPIGSFGVASTMADVTFVGTTMYGMQAAGSHVLHTVDLLTGAATATADGGTSEYGGGGLAHDTGGVMFLTPDSITSPPGSLYTIDTAGNRNLIGALSGAPILVNGVSMVINAMDTDGSTLYGINGQGATHLVTINSATGEITDIGRLPDRSDALAIAPGGEVPEPSTLSLLGAGIAALIIRRRRA